MRQDGSPPRPLPLVLGVAVSLAGIGAMLGATVTASTVLPIVGFRVFLVLCEVALVLPATVALLALRGSTWRHTLAWFPPGRPTLLRCAALGATLWIASLGLLELQYAVWAPDPGYIDAFRHLHEMLRPHGPLDALASLVAIAIVPALFEETLVRGVLLPSLLLRLPAAASIALSALLFAFMHDAYRMPFTFAVGLALGALRLRTGSLAPSMVAHASLNALTFAAAPFLDDPSGPLPDPRPWLGALLLAAGAATTAWAWKALPKKDR